MAMAMVDRRVSELTPWWQKETFRKNCCKQGLAGACFRKHFHFFLALQPDFYRCLGFWMVWVEALPLALR